jgi:hypothetical protein
MSGKFLFWAEVEVDNGRISAAQGRRGFFTVD